MNIYGIMGIQRAVELIRRSFVAEQGIRNYSSTYPSALEQHFLPLLISRQHQYASREERSHYDDYITLYNI
jgi:hypothetical protein